VIFLAFWGSVALLALGAHKFEQHKGLLSLRLTAVIGDHAA
jgi:hypothetical protein